MFAPSHWHENLELIFLTDGQLQVYTPSGAFPIGTGEVGLIHGREIHETQSNGYVAGYLLQISPDFLKHHVPDIEWIRFPVLYAQENEKLEALAQLFVQMNTVFTQKEKGYPFLFSSLLHKLLYLIFLDAEEMPHDSATHRNNRNFERIACVMRYVQEHYKEPITLADAAEIVALQPEYFCRFFRSYTGHTFFEYVNAVRLSAFHDMLLHTDEEITTLTEQCGFAESKTFRKHFYQVYGCTPSSYRKKHHLLKKQAPS
jgi:AraC-like DNA-binding protein